MDELDALITGAAIPGLEPVRARAMVGDAVAARECLVRVTSGGDIAGFIITSVRSFFGRDFIRLIFVSSNHRRCGIGVELLEAATSHATTDTVFTSTNESNSAMRQLLARDGWSFSGTLTGLDEGNPELVFWSEVKKRRKPIGNSK